MSHRQKFRNWTCLVFCSFVLSQNAGLDKTVQSQIYWTILKTVLTCRHSCYSIALPWPICCKQANAPASSWSYLSVTAASTIETATFHAPPVTDIWPYSEASSMPLQLQKSFSSQQTTSAALSNCYRAACEACLCVCAGRQKETNICLYMYSNSCSCCVNAFASMRPIALCYCRWK